MAAVRSRLDEASWEAAWAEGRAMTFSRRLRIRTRSTRRHRGCLTHGSGSERPYASHQLILSLILPANIRSGPSRKPDSAPRRLQDFEK